VVTAGIMPKQWELEEISKLGNVTFGTWQRNKTW
jgi:hypothetical protein